MIVRFPSILAVVGFAALHVTAAAAEVSGLKPPNSEAEIERCVQMLGDASYERRVTAMRRLCAAGNRVRGALQKAADGGNPEISLRAEQILTALDRLWFLGVEVRLAFDEKEVSWDEPVDLSVTLANRSEFPARVPFETGTNEEVAANADARQVAALLDAADFLKVAAANGAEVELHVDDIEADAAVAEEVRERLDARPATILQPGDVLTINLREFNRGWGRYRLLDQGEYAVRLVYEPQWDDEVVAAQRVGRLVSEPASLRITHAAPATVARGDAEAAVSVIQEGDSLVAALVNRTDQVLFVNKHFGAAAPFAVGKWVHILDGSVREVPVSRDAPADWNDFDADLLVPVAPGDTVELARTRLAELLDEFVDKGAGLWGERWTVHFSYVSFLDRRWQRRQGTALLGNASVPKVLREPLPRNVLSARHASNRLAAPQAR